MREPQSALHLISSILQRDVERIFDLLFSSPTPLKYLNAGVEIEVIIFELWKGYLLQLKLVM